MYSYYEQSRRKCRPQTQMQGEGHEYGAPRSRETRGRPQGDAQGPCSSHIQACGRRKEIPEHSRFPYGFASVTKSQPLPRKPSPKTEAVPSGDRATAGLPVFLRSLLPGCGTGDLMALLILLLLLWEGGEDSRDTVLALLIFLFL